jgi:hypothetical protein
MFNNNGGVYLLVWFFLLLFFIYLLCFFFIVLDKAFFTKNIFPVNVKLLCDDMYAVRANGGVTALS